MDLSYLLQQTIIDDLPNAHHSLGNTMLDKLWPWGPFLFGALERRTELTRTMTGVCPCPSAAALTDLTQAHRGSTEPGQLVGVGTDSDSCHRKVQGLKCLQHYTILRPKPKTLHLSTV